MGLVAGKGETFLNTDRIERCSPVFCFVRQNLHHPGVVNLQDMFDTPVKVRCTQYSYFALLVIKRVSVSSFDE